MTRAVQPRWWLRPALALAVLVLCLGVGEVAVRLIKPGQWEKPSLRDLDGNERPLSEVIGYFSESGMTKDGRSPLTNLRPDMVVRGCYDRPRWDYFDDEGCVEYRMNSHGFRDEEFARKKPPTELRVLALGDSFTFGLGVQQPDVWTEVLQHRLAVQHQRPVQVINGGFACGYSPFLYAPWLSKVGMSFEPDVVIVGLCLNDMGDIPMMAYNFEAADFIPPGPSALWDYVKRLQRMRIVEQAVQKSVSDPTSKQFDFGQVIERDPGHWLGTLEALKLMRDLTAQNGVRLVVAVFPMISCLSSGYPFAPLHAMATEGCAELGIDVIDLAPPFMGLDDPDLWAHPTDQHPNDVGQAMLGNGIADWLEAHP